MGEGEGEGNFIAVGECKIVNHFEVSRFARIQV